MYINPTQPAVPLIDSLIASVCRLLTAIRRHTLGVCLGEVGQSSRQVAVAWQEDATATVAG